MKNIRGGGGGNTGRGKRTKVVIVDETVKTKKGGKR